MHKAKVRKVKVHKVKVRRAKVRKAKDQGAPSRVVAGVIWSSNVLLFCFSASSYS